MSVNHTIKRFSTIQYIASTEDALMNTGTPVFKINKTLHLRLGKF